MGKVTDSEILESYDRTGMLLDELDDDLIRHIFCEDEGPKPPQGLHRGGYKEPLDAEETDQVH